MNKPCFSFVLAAILLVTAPIASAAGPAPRETRRFALLVGANDGGAGRVELRYAGTDASNLARVLRGLGGFSTRDVILVAGDPDAAAVRTALASLRTKLAEARKSASRIEVLFYYSGHSDATGLLIAGERIPYAALRHRLDGMTADVTIAILDSCSSGAFTRAKGGTAQPAFLIDESSQVEGYAFISSSSADEVAQESDRIGSSFFTHYFISGLRGAADANRDRQITLNEAYQFTFAETVARTQATRGGVQHPAFRMHLAGTGDVVITDIRDTSATLLVSASVAGRLFVRDGHGDLAVELSKASGRPVRLGLSPGRYRVTLEHGRGTDRAEVILVSGKVTRLEPSAFSAVALEAATARGDAPVTAVPVSISLVPPISTDAIAHAPVHQTIAINLIAGSAQSLTGLSISGAVSLLSGPARGIQLAGFGNVAGEATAIQIGGFGNVVAGPMIGFQAGGFGNFAGGDSRGIQIGGFGNVAGGEMRGIQIGGFGNSAGTMTGLQIGGFGNSAGTMTGLQLAGGTNVAEHIRGVQLGTVNVGGE
ncbi:MAG TPA: caspase family protein, partial [Kofleriaceae bacterium]|nr:caspase family protein [Kofleriaceae bacterium]